MAIVLLTMSLIVGGAAARAAGARTVAPPMARTGHVIADLPVPQPDPQQAKSDADDILARPEYQPPPQSILERIGSWLSDHLSEILRNVNGGAGGPIVWIVLAALVGVVVFFLLRLRGGSGLRRRHGDDDPLFVTELEARRTPTQWLTEAERLEGEGAWKQALRARFRALLGQLIDRGALRDLPGRTTGEYRIELARRAPSVAAEFREASGLFDAAWYGDEPTGPSENQRFRALADAVLAGSRGRPEPEAAAVGGPLGATAGDQFGDRSGGGAG